MLIIRKNLVNNLIATVSMNKTLNNPYYLFSFQHIASKERISFIPERINSNVRYDKFTFIEAPTTNLNATPPQVYFQYLGQYYYSIYEQLSPTNTNIDLTYNKLESGRAWVIVGNDNTQECFFEPYISNDEDFSQIIYVSEEELECQQVIQPTPSSTPPVPVTPSPTPTIGTTPTPTPTGNQNCITLVCQATPQRIYNYNMTTNQMTFLFSYSGCAALDMALTDTKLYYYDGCQDLYEYNYTYNGTQFTQSFNKSWDPLPGKAWGAGLTAKNNNVLISSSGYTLSNTIDDYTTIFEYDLTTSGYTTLFQLPFNYIVSGDILYSPQSGQLVISAHKPFDSSSSGIFCYDLSGNLLNVIYTPDWIWYGLYYDNITGKMYSFNQSGFRWELDWNANRYYNRPQMPQDWLFGAGQKFNCQNFTIPVIYPVTPTQTPSNTPTPTFTPTPSITPSIPSTDCKFYIIHNDSCCTAATLSYTDCNGIPQTFNYSAGTFTSTKVICARQGTVSITDSSYEIIEGDDCEPNVLPFRVSFGGTANDACSNLSTGSTIVVYAQDLGNCGPCDPLTCWACLTTGQQLYLNSNLTIIVPDGYYANDMSFGNDATWNVVGGFPQGGGFMSCP